MLPDRQPILGGMVVTELASILPIVGGAAAAIGGGAAAAWLQVKSQVWAIIELG
jgi:hypothetical protein